MRRSSARRSKRWGAWTLRKPSRRWRDWPEPSPARGCEKRRWSSTPAARRPSPPWSCWLTDSRTTARLTFRSRRSSAWRSCRTGSESGHCARQPALTRAVRYGPRRDAAWKRFARPSRGRWGARRETRRSVGPHQVERIDGDLPIGGEPVEVGFGHTPGRARVADRLANVDRVTRRHQHAAQVEIAGDETGAVVDQDGGPTVIEIGDQGDDAAVRRPHRRAPRRGEVDTPVTASQYLVEHACHAEHARHCAAARAHERRLPQPRGLVRPPSHLLHHLLLEPDAHGQRLRWLGILRSDARSEEHTFELQSRLHLVCRLLLEKKKNITTHSNFKRQKIYKQNQNVTNI